MTTKAIMPDIYWVGAIDWKLRNFHGYETEKGSSYNAYLIKDEKTVLVDTVKHYLFDDLRDNIARITDPSKIDYVVVNHVEMDHSGCLPRIMDMNPKAVIITSPNGEKGLRKHFKKDWTFKIVNTGDTVKIGERTLTFVLCPMVHWPDSMVTYVREDKLLLSNDAFGQHLATSERFDDEYPADIIKEEAAKYYANIVMPYGSQVVKLLGEASKLDIRMIAPSHGIIWKNGVADIVGLYKKWANNVFDNKAVIVYDTMWGSTEKMAYALRDIFTEKGISCDMRSLQANHMSEVMTGVLNARYICVGSSTLNNDLLPSVSSFLCYCKGLAPRNRTGIAFGSYGWGGQSIGAIEKVLDEMKWTVPVRGLKVQYVPDEADLKAFQDKVRQIIQ